MQLVAVPQHLTSSLGPALPTVQRLTLRSVANVSVHDIDTLCEQRIYFVHALICIYFSNNTVEVYIYEAENNTSKI